MRISLVTAALALLACLGQAHAQSYRSTVNEGNDLYHKKQYDVAKEKYRRAAALDTSRLESHFNLGNSEYRGENYGEALKHYKKAGEKARSAEDASNLLYNAGNTFLDAAEKGKPALPDPSATQGPEARMKDYGAAIELYKQALKRNPKDEDARYNLAYATRRLDMLQQQQQQNKDKNKDKQKQKQKDEKNQDKDSKDKDKQNQQNKQDQKDQQKQDQNKQQQKQPQDQKDQNKQDQQKQPQPRDQKQMSKQQAEQILKALERDEKDLQKKLRAKKSVRVNVDKDW